MMDCLKRLLICFDFDGVLHQYTKWEGANVASGEPVPGAIEYLRSMLHDERFAVCIYSARNHQSFGISTMRLWLTEHGLDIEEVLTIAFPINKPGAHIFIDDRAFAFQGTFPTLDDVVAFKPYWRITGYEPTQPTDIIDKAGS